VEAHPTLQGAGQQASNQRHYISLQNE